MVIDAVLKGGNHATMASVRWAGRIAVRPLPAARRQSIGPSSHISLISLARPKEIWEMMEQAMVII
jgi:hypothetical protein